MITKLQETKRYILNEIGEQKPKIGVVLGSGLGVLAEQIESQLNITYGEIPHFPVSTVAGHAGQLVFGSVGGKQVVAMQGRFHFYEGYNMDQVTYPIKIMKMLGVEKLIVTNAAGGVNTNFEPGDLMIINDHINLMGSNPLMGPNIDELGPRFPDMSEAYAKDLRKLAFSVANKKKLVIKEGIYAGVMGPSYETPAEIRYLRTIGADAVGMSTVPEVIIANHCNIKILGISCITNMAAGVLDVKLSHNEVMETAERVKEQFISLLKGIMEKL